MIGKESDVINNLKAFKDISCDQKAHSDILKQKKIILYATTLLENDNLKILELCLEIFANLVANESTHAFLLSTFGIYEALEALSIRLMLLMMSTIAPKNLITGTGITKPINLMMGLLCKSLHFNTINCNYKSLRRSWLTIAWVTGNHILYMGPMAEFSPARDGLNLVGCLKPSFSTSSFNTMMRTENESLYKRATEITEILRNSAPPAYNTRSRMKGNKPFKKHHLFLLFIEDLTKILHLSSSDEDLEGDPLVLSLTRLPALLNFTDWARLEQVTMPHFLITYIYLQDNQKKLENTLLKTKERIFTKCFLKAVVVTKNIQEGTESFTKFGHGTERDNLILEDAIFQSVPFSNFVPVSYEKLS
ncbi:hypothetical protein NQ317_016354 [Molorchus minor]|uniref:Uncharacterized protein n=1 Tax=Molorchus minor TaxID=1323400 RepID=A0ABQ9JK60_9CUCU|nr:hypothetical protein NQ317_016354 [Molorchus minor]